MTGTDLRVPATLMETVKYFSDPAICVEFMAALRWNDGPVCPLCDRKRLSFLQTRLMWKCLDCKKQFSVKVGTIFEDSPIGLDKWLCGMWMIANDKNGVSSYEVGKALGITQRSAWFLLHRIRYAMHTGTFAKLSGEVEIDETFIGGKARNSTRQSVRKRSKAVDRKATRSCSEWWSAAVKLLPDMWTHVRGKTSIRSSAKTFWPVQRSSAMS